MGTKLFRLTLGLVLAGAFTQFASADQVGAELMVGDFDFQRPGADFAMLDTPVASPRGELVPVGAPSHLTSASIAAIRKGSLLVDPDSGMLVQTDDKGEARAQLFIGKDASQLVVDRMTDKAYIANRSGDSISVVSFAGKLKQVTTFKTHAEPYGVALTPDRKTLLVTTVADRQLSAIDVATGKELWTLEVGPEPRGVAISPNGKEAMVTFISTAAVARIPLRGDKHTPRFVPLDRSVPKPAANQQFFRPQIMQKSRSINFDGPFDGMGVPSSSPTLSANVGRRFSRAAFSATYVGSDMAIVPHQESTPEMASTGSENTGVYGGGSSFERPIQHRLAFFSTRDGEFEKMAKAEIGLHQPRAIRYDSNRDMLYVAGYGSDAIIAIADASKPSIHLQSKTMLSNAADPCGPTGLDIADDGKIVAFCSLSRKVATVMMNDKIDVKRSSSLTKSRFTPAAQRGRQLFRSGNNPQLSTNGVMACESCHPEVRADGLSWRIGGMALQTPLLAGKVAGTHPFKWDGGDKDLHTSLTHTVTRLGGTGINKAQAKDIAAFLTETAAPRTPTPKSTKAVARGKKLFRSKEVGCASCHSGKLRSDGKLYDIAEDLGKVDTPALVGLTSSAPYYHDGSAATLRSLLLENGTIHAMGNMSALSDDNVDDLVAYLETL